MIVLDRHTRRKTCWGDPVIPTRETSITSVKSAKALRELAKIKWGRKRGLFSVLADVTPTCDLFILSELKADTKRTRITRSSSSYVCMRSRPQARNSKPSSVVFPRCPIAPSLPRSFARLILGRDCPCDGRPFISDLRKSRLDIARCLPRSESHTMATQGEGEEGAGRGEEEFFWGIKKINSSFS